MTTAAITDSLRKNLLKLLSDDVASTIDSDRYYLAFGRTDEWPATIPEPSYSIANQRRVRSDTQGLKRITSASFVVPYTEWSSGTIYNAYNDDDPDQTNFYVVNSSYEVFVCIQAPETSPDVFAQSTVEPTKPTTNPGRTFITGDDYLWRFLYAISPLARSKFITSSWMPVKKITGAPTISEEVEQLAVQDSARPGELIGFTVVSAGTGALTTETVDLTPTAVTRTADFVSFGSSGAVWKVEIDSDGSGNPLHGEGYFDSKATVTGTAVLKAITGPVDGLTADPVATLKAKRIMLQTDVQGNEEAAGLPTLFNDTSRFSQVSLIKNPGTPGDRETGITSDTANTLRRLTVSGFGSSQIGDDITISGSSVGAKLVSKDVGNNYVYYVQNDSTGFGTLDGQTITYSSGGSATVSADDSSMVAADVYSGEILYIDNVNTITRGAGQTEDFRLIINLKDCE